MLRRVAGVNEKQFHYRISLCKYLGDCRQIILLSNPRLFIHWIVLADSEQAHYGILALLLERHQHLHHEFLKAVRAVNNVMRVC